MKIIRLTVGVVSTNCYIVYDEDSRVGAIIDPGDNAVEILHKVEEAELQIAYVLLTHGHFDHILAAHDVVEKTGAELVIHKEDLWLLKREAMAEFKPFIRDYIETSVNLIAEDGTEVSFGSLKAQYLHTPGHTPGSSCICIGDVLFTGDTLFRHECGRCDLMGGDFDKMLLSLKRLYELEGEYTVLPGHDAASTLDEERSHNPYMQQAINV